MTCRIIISLLLLWPQTMFPQTRPGRQRLVPQLITLANGKRYTLNVRAGWRIRIAAEGMSRARFLARSPDNRIFVTDLYNRTDNRKGVIYILADFDAAAGRFRSVSVWQKRLRNPNSLAFYTDAHGAHWLYVALTDKLVRYRYTPGEMSPSTEPQTLASFPDYGLGYKYGGWHLTRTIAVGGNGKIYVSVGSSCNVCEEKEDIRAAVLELNPDGSEQRIIARGLRNAVGLRWSGGRLLTTNMGPDHLGDDKPDDTMFVVTKGSHYGWPYCWQTGTKTFADAQFTNSVHKVKCSAVPQPFVSFPAHSSPLGFDYFAADAQDDLRDSFLVAMHGSGFIRIGHGYSVVQVSAGKPPQDFITGFLQRRKIQGRPVDVMNYDEGFLLTDDYAGVVYYVTREK